MANRTFNELQALQRELKLLAGKVNLSAAAAVSSVSGDIASATKLTTGSYQAKLADSYKSIQNVQLSVESATVQDLQVQIVSIDSVAKTINFKTVVVDAEGAVAAADISAAATIHLLVIAKNS